MSDNAYHAVMVCVTFWAGFDVGRPDEGVRLMPRRLVIGVFAVASVVAVFRAAVELVR